MLRKKTHQNGFPRGVEWFLSGPVSVLTYLRVSECESVCVCLFVWSSTRRAMRGFSGLSLTVMVSLYSPTLSLSRGLFTCTIPV